MFYGIRLGNDTVMSRQCNPHATTQPSGCHRWTAPHLFAPKVMAANKSAIARLIVAFFDGESFMVAPVQPSDPTSAARPARRADCNQSAMASFVAAHGLGHIVILVG